MSRLPKVLTPDRIPDAVLLPLIGAAQVGALGFAAYALRDGFGALQSGAGLAKQTLVELAGAGIVAAVLDLVARRRGEALGQSYATDLRLLLFDHIAGMERHTPAERRPGSLSLRLAGDLAAARLWFGRGLPRLLTAVVAIPGAAVVLWQLDAQLALVVAGPVALSLLVMLALAFGLRARQTRQRSQGAALSTSMTERIAMAPEPDLMARQEPDQHEADGGNLHLGSATVGRMTRVGIVRMVPQIGAALAAASVLSATASLGLAVGQAAAGLLVLAALTLSVRDLAVSWDEWLAWTAAREKALAILAQQVARRVVQARGSTVGLRLAKLRVGAVEVTADVPPGTLAVIAGPKGSGKSHLASIIAGLDRPRQGTILYGGSAVPLPRTTYVGDNSGTIQGSLQRALTLGVEPRPPARMIRRLAEDFGLASLGAPEERGANNGAAAPSPGELLRVRLARGVLTHSDLFVIDSQRFLADPERLNLLASLRRHGNATIVIVAGTAAEFTPDLTFDLDPPPDQDQSAEKNCSFV